jgi:hypothetical protein
MKKKNLLMTTIAIFGLALCSNAQIPNYVPSNGLVGWWPFNGNANDESLNGLNGTNNLAQATTDRNNIANHAFMFNGSSSHIIIPNSTQLNFQNNNSFTLSYWINASSLSNSQISLILSKQTGAASSQDGFNSNIEVNNSSNFRISNGSSTASYALGSLVNMIQINNWNHIVQIFSGNEGFIYINGVLISNTTGNAIIGDNTADLLIGKPNWVAGNAKHFHGKIDDIGIWNRALTAQEITNLFNAVNCSNNLTISPATSQLQSGSTAIFVATTSDTLPNYTWQSDLGQGFQTLNNYGNYSGVNTNSLSISNVQLPNHTQPIRVISASGECIDTSNVASINITDTCIVTINDTITTLISVTDTLIINTLITGLTPPNNLNTIKVFPNPANNHITIDFGNFALMNGYNLKITNSIGQIVFSTPINQQSNYVDLSTWGGNGIYFVQIIDTQNNTIENRKIVLQ